MRIRPNERQYISDILREELERANDRIGERLAQFECGPPVYKDDQFDGVRRFYDDLVNKDWNEADEECLQTLGDKNEEEIKAMMREAFRRSRVHPIPSFSSLINVLKKGEGDSSSSETIPRLGNPDAVSSDERERLANILRGELTEAAQEISLRLGLSDSKSEIVREQLEIAEGSIVSRFTPLV